MDFSLTVQAHVIRVCVDSARASGDTRLTERMERIEAALNLLPVEHVRMIVEPIVVVDRFPGGRSRGGGWFSPTDASAWTTAGGVRNTGVSAEVMRARIAANGGTGVVGISTEAFLRSEDWGMGHWACEFTLLHEVGHSIDFHAGLIPPTTLAGRDGNTAYQGQRYPGGSVGELAAEAYSRFFLRPSSMCRGGNGTPPCLREDGTPSVGACTTQRRCSGRLQRDLRATPAFAATSVVFPLAMAPAPIRHGAPASALAHATHVLPPIDGINPRSAWRSPGPSCFADAHDVGAGTGTGIIGLPPDRTGACSDHEA